MKNSIKIGATLVGGTILSLYGGVDASAKEGEVAVQLQGINDLHGQLEGTGSVYEYGKKLEERGGSAPLLATYLDESKEKFNKEKNEDAVTLRVQAGDMVGASQAISGILQDEPTMKALKKMDFKVGTIGNHEFDEGLAEYNRVLRGEKPKAGEFNKAVDNYNREDTGMEITIANVTNKSDGKVPFGWSEYLVRELKDKEGEKARVGFIGVVTEEIPTLVLKKQWEAYNVSDPATAINKYSKILREKEGVNAIVVLAHASATSEKDNDTDIKGEVRKIIDGLDKDTSVDIIFAGHNHVITNGVYKGIRVVEGASHGKAFADVKAIYDTKTNDFKEINASVVPVLAKKDGVTVELRKDIKEVAKDASERIKEIIEAKVTTADGVITRKPDFPDGTPAYKTSPANLESQVGNLITDAQLKAAREAGFNADFAITNNGGIRSDLEVTKDGIVTWGAAQKVQPFGNVMQVVEISGKDLISALNSQYNSEEKYFLQMSGLGYSYKEAPDGTLDAKGKPIKWVVDKAWIEKDGKHTLLKEEAKYVGVINDFLYGGGDDFPELSGPEHSTLLGALDPDTEIFVKYLKSSEKITTPKVGDRKVYYKDLKFDFSEKVVEKENKEEKQTTPTTQSDEKQSDKSTEVETNKPVVTEENNKETTVENKKEEKEKTETNKKEEKVDTLKSETKEKVSKKEDTVKTLPNTGNTNNSYVTLGFSILLGALALRKITKK